MATKLGDICVKTGSYEKNGETKNQYKNIGRLMANDDGGKFILIDSTAISMQLFALCNKGRESHVIASVFEEQQGQGGGSRQQQGGGGDDIPI